MNRLRNKFKANQLFIENFLSLSTLQLMNYVLPIITFPYLVRVLHPDKFGLVNFAAAFVGYFAMLTDYGFNLSATREIAIHRHDLRKVSEVVSAVFSVKAIMFILSFLLFISLLFSFEKFYSESALYFYSFLLVGGNLLTPFWLFQGFEKMKFVTVTTFIVRVLYVILIFLLIKSESDYLLLALVNGLTALSIGIISFLLMLVFLNIHFVVPTASAIKTQFREGGLLFLSSFSITIYTVSNTFILGLFASNTIVGYFSAADKIRAAIQNLFSPVTQSIYPHVSFLFSQSKEKAFTFLKKSFSLTGSISFIICLLVFLYAGEITSIVLGDQFAPSAIVLRILAFLPFIILLSNLFGVQTMLNLGFAKQFTIYIVAAGLFNLLISFLLVPKYGEIGSSVSVLATELFVTASMIIFVKRRMIV